MEPHQQPQGAGSGQSQGGQSAQTTPIVPPGSQSIEGGNTEAHCKGCPDKASEEVSEFWPFGIFGHRLKITDSLLALFTFFLVAVGVVQGGALIRSVNLAREVFAAEHRAWLKVEVAMPDTITFNSGGWFYR